MKSRSISPNLMAALVLVAVATGGGLYWWFKIGPHSPHSQNLLLEESKTPEAWRSIRLAQTLSEPINRHDWVSFLAVSADGNKLVSGLEMDNQIRIWDLEKGKVIHTFEGASDSITKISIDSEEKKIASIADNNQVKLWNLETGKLLQSFDDYSGDIKFILFSTDGKALITVSETKADKNNEKIVKILEVWEFNDDDQDDDKEKLVKTFEAKLGKGKVGAIAFNPERQLLAVNTQETNRVDLWHLGQKKKLADLFVQFPEVRTIAFSKDGASFAISGGEGIVELWHLEVNKPNDLFRNLGIKESIGKLERIHTLTANTGIINALVFSSDGNTLFTGARDRTVNIWNVSNGDLVHILSGNSAWVEALAVIPRSQPEDEDEMPATGEMLVTGTTLGEIKLWQPDSQTPPLREEVVENIRKLRGTSKCQQCDLSGADLRNFSLSEVDLQGANLSNANLSKVNLSEANLRRAILFETNLEQAILQKANLEEANLEKANLKGANITDAKLGGAILKGTIMPDGKVSDSQSEEKIEESQENQDVSNSNQP